MAICVRIFGPQRRLMTLEIPWGALIRHGCDNADHGSPVVSGLGLTSVNAAGRSADHLWRPGGSENGRTGEAHAWRAWDRSEEDNDVV